MTEKLYVDVLPGGDPSDQEVLSRDLRLELNLIGIAAEWASETTQVDSKGSDAIMYALLALPLLNDAETVRAALNCIFGWLPRQRSCTITIRCGKQELTVTDLSGRDARVIADTKFLQQIDGRDN